jgi:hypothetical protein
MISISNYYSHELEMNTHLAEQTTKEWKTAKTIAEVATLLAVGNSGLVLFEISH